MSLLMFTYSSPAFRLAALPLSDSPPSHIRAPFDQQRVSHQQWQHSRMSERNTTLIQDAFQKCITFNLFAVQRRGTWPKQEALPLVSQIMSRLSVWRLAG